MNTVEVKRERLYGDALDQFSGEASELGFRPGQFPEQFEVSGLGNGMPFFVQSVYRVEGEVLYVKYHQYAGCTSIKVFND